MKRAVLSILSFIPLFLGVQVASANGLLACSGPGAWALMTEADIYASWCAFWVLLLLVPTLYLLARSGHPTLASAHLMLLVIHPSWTVSAWHGDCGDFKRLASTIFVILSAIGLLESVLVATFLQRPWPWKRVKIGCCSRCGYDLRASTKRCPECGEPIHDQGKRTTA